ncbi:hypothetical protein AVEN_162377-1 [Araneus ventricosus]|uniref:Uncharacterized protein n=1 Tax=Araneus ventricosus TaxID=182803 RepID=A0A4Y2GI69_ARAVE|nr:hypothetical protein AVEN_162377-1 [Araneus ventricosus]
MDGLAQACAPEILHAPEEEMMDYQASEPSTRIGLISGSSSYAFWISPVDQLSSVVIVKAFMEISVSISNFFSAFEQCLLLSIQVR